MDAVSLEEELCEYIHKIPKYRLRILKPLLADYAEPDYVVESDLTDEERAIIAEEEKFLDEHPEECVRLEDFLKRKGISLK